MDPGTIISVVEITGKTLVYLAEVAKEIKDAPDSLAAVIAETSKLHLQMQRFSTIQRDLPRDAQIFLNEQVNTLECRAIVNRLQELSLKIQPHDKMTLSGRVKWLWNKNTVEELVSSLSREADRLDKLLTPEQIVQVLGVTNKILTTSDQINEKIQGLIDLVSQLKLSQPSLNQSSPAFDQNGQDFSMPYFQDRDRLANAAYRGDWSDVKRLLEHADITYRQRWINTTRIYQATETNVEPSGFTALHQAAFHGNKSAVEYLIRNGAWKCLRTYRDTSSKPKYSTPLDIARASGWQHLYEPLSPLIRRTVSFKVLLNLQDRLHKLIYDDFGSHPDAHLDCFVLPELEILTEFERSRLWFPLNPELPDTRYGLAVHMALDGNELVVVSRWGRKTKKNYRISESGVQEIEQAVILT